MISYQQTVNSANRSNVIVLSPPMFANEQLVSVSPGLSPQNRPLVRGVPSPRLMQAMIASRLASRAPIIPQVPSASTLPLHLQNKPSVAGFRYVRTIGPSPPLSPTFSKQSGIPSIPSASLATMNKANTPPLMNERVVSRRAIVARLLAGHQPMSATYSTMPGGKRQYIDQVLETDVLCGRGGKTNNHGGNKRYRQVIDDMKVMYKSTQDKGLKTDLSRAIVEHVYSYGGRFVKRDEKMDRYYVLPKSEARLKTSQALRESKKSKWTS